MTLIFDNFYQGKERIGDEGDREKVKKVSSFLPMRPLSSCKTVLQVPYGLVAACRMKLIVER